MSKKLLLLQLMLCEDTDGYFVIQLSPCDRPFADLGLILSLAQLHILLQLCL